MTTPSATPWNPPVGRIIFRTLTWAPGRSSSCLGVASKPANEHGTTHYESIAEIDSEGKARPSFCGWVNSASLPEDTSGAGHAIVQRLATDEDIDAVVRAWQPRYSIADWIEDIDAAVGSLILPEELARVRRIVAAGPWNPPPGRLFLTTYTDPDGPRLCALAGLGRESYKPSVDLCYRLTEGPRFRCAVILNGSQKETAWTTGGAETVTVEGLEPASYTTGPGIRIERRMATDDDLRMVLRVWDHHGFSLDQWLMSVRMPRWLDRSYAAIATEDLDRLRRLIAEVKKA